MLVANSRGRHLAANAIANLRSVGIEHYLLVTNTKEACEGMRRTRGSKSASGEAASWRVECAWTSFLLGHPRLATYGLTQGEERSDPFRLWWARFHLLERLVAFGYNPMYVDTDVSFRVNPYPLLKGPFALRARRPGRNRARQRREHRLRVRAERARGRAGAQSFERDGREDVRHPGARAGSGDAVGR